MPSWFGSNTKLAETAKFSIIEDIAITPNEIGKGSYGVVYAAVLDGKQCVAKELHPYLSHANTNQGVHKPLETFVREINILSPLKHPSIVQFLGVHFREKSHTPILIMERLWKNLYDILNEQPKQLFLLTKGYILYDVVCGLKYLHNQKKPVAHRDLHPSNILLNENFNAKLADLGQAKLIANASAQKLSRVPGNPAYMAPETLTHDPTYDTKVDVFSLGCTTIHLITEKFPAPTDQFVESVKKDGSYQKVSEADRRLEFLNMMGDIPELRKMTFNCLEDDPAKRPTASDICSVLEKYTQQLEKEAPKLTERHKQNKNSLLRLLQSQEDQLEKKSKLIKDINEDKRMLDDAITKKEEYISTLESQLLDGKSKLEKIEVNLSSVQRERDSLKKNLADQDEVTKQITTTYRIQENRLREEVKMLKEEAKMKQQETNATKLQMEKEMEILQSRLKDEKAFLSQERQKVEDLQGTLEKSKKDFEQVKENLGEANANLTKKNEALELQLSQLQYELEEKVKYNVAVANEKDEIIAALNEKLKNQQQQLTELTQADDELKSELTNLHQKYKTLQEVKEKQQVETFYPAKTIVTTESQLYQKLLELQNVYENEHQQLQLERQSYVNTFKQQDEKVADIQGQLTDLRKKYATQKQQLVAKSYRLSTLESELQDSSHSKEEKLKFLEKDNEILKKQLEANDNIQRNFEKDLKRKEESLKRKEEELQLRKKEHADEINNLHDQYNREINDLQKSIEMYESQIANKEKVKELQMNEAQYKSDFEKNAKDKVKKLEDELKSYTKTAKRLIRAKDADINEKVKCIESFEKHFYDDYYGRYNYDIYWYPYLSLPAKTIRPSIAVIEDKVFVADGYQLTNPQGRELELYLKSLKSINAVYRFYTVKCRCDTIASPVLLGAVASVNGQCVLVSGVDSVGNTLTGNVYVLCEEGSHDQWKEFSKPLPTPRILPCACCYGNRWLIVCGGFAYRPKQGSGILEATNVVEILDATKKKWYTLPEGNCPSFSTILCCAVVGEDVYVVGSDQVIKTSCNKLIKAASTTNNTLVWDEVQIGEAEESSGKIYPFSAVEVNGEPMIIASMTDGEDDVTCVVMKDTTGRWRIMSKAVECQHRSAAVVTSSLELLLFGGSEKILVEEATEISQKGTLIPTLSIQNSVPIKKALFTEPSNKPLQGVINPDSHLPVTANQPAYLSFTGPIHTIQFDHKGGTFQSPIHKVSLVVPPNALSDGEKVTVYMGATTSGSFDLPEDCKLRSAVVWLSVSPSDVEFKRTVSVTVPHSAVFTNPQHPSMMRFVTCEDCDGTRYKFNCSLNQFEIDEEQGWIELNDECVMVAIIAGPEFIHNQEDKGFVEGLDSYDEFQDALEEIEFPVTSNGLASNSIHDHWGSSPVQDKLTVPPARYLAKLFWPCGELPSSFRADIYYLQNLPTELHKVDTLYRKAYFEDNGAYPEIVETEFMINGDGAGLRCILPCSDSSECDCMTGWDVTQLNDVNEVPVEQDKIRSVKYKIDPMKFSFKFNCFQTESKCSLSCCFEFQGVDQIRKHTNDQLPLCLQQRSRPFTIGKGIHHSGIEEQTALNGCDHEVKVKIPQDDEGVTRSCQPTEII